MINYIYAYHFNTPIPLLCINFLYLSSQYVLFFFPPLFLLHKFSLHGTQYYPNIVNLKWWSRGFISTHTSYTSHYLIFLIPQCHNHAQIWVMIPLLTQGTAYAPLRSKWGQCALQNLRINLTWYPNILLNSLDQLVRCQLNLHIVAQYHPSTWYRCILDGLLCFFH